MDISIDSIRETVSVWAISYPEIVQIILFGSQARGDSKPNSDIDLAFILEAVSGESAYTRYCFERHKWKRELESILGLSISMVRKTHNGKPDIQENIERDGIVIYEKSFA